VTNIEFVTLLHPRNAPLRSGLPEDGEFITAQLAGNEVVHSVVLTKARNPLSREDVESRFKGELSKK
jgi:hypothetical protein